MLLFPKRTSFGEPGASACGLAEDGRAACADDDALGVGEHCRDLVTARALDIHEVGVRVLDQALQLVLALLFQW
ncbi:hypothetical protein GE061_015427 [Apolygus lucorum]|uniref:Uncharacterized protein n=1 Tax=Apolygus lucorum TaxID=248454 RepID=A0A6A4IH50_APOLU|nr:hypothetical protein GE061_015427 [Apolygus lucorum]